MKYCSNCGKELSDEAALCTGCGCQVVNRNTDTSANINKQINTALILNIFAVILSFSSGFAYSGLQAGRFVTALDCFFTQPLVYRLFALVCVSFVIVLFVKAVSRRRKLRKFAIWLYVVSVVITIIYMVCFSLIYLLIAISGYGIFMILAPILQVIAVKMLLRANN